MSVELTVLKKAHVAQAPTPVESPASREADRRLDGTWGATRDIVSAVLSLPDEPEMVAEANKLNAALFPTGLDFLAIKFTNQWAESESRMQRITDQQLEASFEKLGIVWVLRRLEKEHGNYGKAVGVTKLKESAPPPPALTEPFQRFTDALRVYVVRVVGIVSARRPETQALANALLAPVQEWKSKQSSPAEAATPEPAPRASRPERVEAEPRN